MKGIGEEEEEEEEEDGSKRRDWRLNINSFFSGRETRNGGC